MKRLLLTTAIMTCFCFAEAQTEEGTWLTGGATTMSFSSTSIDNVDDNVNTFSLQGNAGYFLMDDLTVGLILGFSNTSQGDVTFSSTIIGPFGRYYINGTFFVGAGFGIQSASTDSGDSEVDTTGGSVLLEAGYPIWLNDTFAFEPSLNYAIGTGGFSSSSTFTVGVGISAYLR